MGVYVPYLGFSRLLLVFLFAFEETPLRFPVKARRNRFLGGQGGSQRGKDGAKGAFDHWVFEGIRAIGKPPFPLDERNTGIGARFRQTNRDLRDSGVWIDGVCQRGWGAFLQYTTPPA